MSDNNDSNEDMPIRKRASLVWQYFEKLTSFRIKCRICQNEHRYMGTTANALRHLKAKHNIDARPVGLTDPENVKRMKALSTSGIPFKHNITAINLKNECRFDEEDYDDDEVGGGSRQSGIGVREMEEQHVKNNRNCSQIFYDNEPDIDPYVNNYKFQDDPLAKPNNLAKSSVYSTTNARRNTSPTTTAIIENSALHTELEKLKTEALVATLKAEARYFNELADLTHSKRVYIDLQCEQLRTQFKKS